MIKVESKESHSDLIGRTPKRES